MKKKIIAIVIGILCVIVAAIGLFQFAFKTKATYVKDVDSDKFNKAYDLLANLAGVALVVFARKREA